MKFRTKDYKKYIIFLLQIGIFYEWNVITKIIKFCKKDNVANSNQINQNTTNNNPTVANKQIPKAGFSVLEIIAIIIAL